MVARPPSGLHALWSPEPLSSSALSPPDTTPRCGSAPARLDDCSAASIGSLSALCHLVIVALYVSCLLAATAVLAARDDCWGVCCSSSDNNSHADWAVSCTRIVQRGPIPLLQVVCEEAWGRRCFVFRIAFNAAVLRARLAQSFASLPILLPLLRAIIYPCVLLIRPAYRLAALLASQERPRYVSWCTFPVPSARNGVGDWVRRRLVLILAILLAFCRVITGPFACTYLLPSSTI